MERRPLVEAIVLAAVAGEHVLVVGPPGTGKSEAARRVARVLGGSYFEYLLSRFSEPSELFGPVDLRALQEGRLETVVEGMLPEADVAFLDEVFSGSTAILNALLTLLNERVFRRGTTRLACPLKVCIGATNALPRDEALAAFADRFLVRVFVEPVADSLLEALLEGGGGEPPRLDARLPLGELSAAAAAVDLAPVRPLLAQALRALRGAGIDMSDRRAVRSQRLLAAAAALEGRKQAGPADLWALLLAIPEAEGQRAARELLTAELARADSASLAALAEDLSSGPLTRARRLGAQAESLLAASMPADRSWRLRVQGVLRDIDAAFGPGGAPPELGAMRSRLVTALA